MNYGQSVALPHYDVARYDSAEDVSRGLPRDSLLFNPPRPPLLRGGENSGMKKNRGPWALPRASTRTSLGLASLTNYATGSRPTNGREHGAGGRGGVAPPRTEYGVQRVTAVFHGLYFGVFGGYFGVFGGYFGELSPIIGVTSDDGGV